MVTCLRLLVLGLVIHYVCSTFLPKEDNFADTFKSPSGLGPKCKQKFCVKGATCSHHLHKCVCPAGEVGFGLFECLLKGWIHCRSMGDPHISTFSGAMGRLNMPCRQRMTEFTTTSSSSLNLKCVTDVFATNVYRNGRYYAEEVDGQIRVQKKVLFNKIVTFSISRDGVTLQFSWTRQTKTFSWGTNGIISIFTIQLIITYDTVQNYVLVSCPACFLRIKFRPTILTAMLQPLLPGIAVSTKKYLIYPRFRFSLIESLCGTLKDGADFLENRMTQLGLPDVESVLLYDWLATGVAQNRGAQQAQCAATVTSFDNCPSARQVSCVGQCGAIFNDVDLNSCLRDQGITDSISIFNNCIEGYCQQDATACQASVSALTACAAFGPSWIHDQDCSSYL